MTTRSQKRKAVAEVVFGGIETSAVENDQPESLIAGPSASRKIQPENLEETNVSLRKEIKFDLAELLAENQKEMMTLVAPTSKNHLLFKTFKILIPRLTTSPPLERQQLWKPMQLWSKLLQ